MRPQAQKITPEAIVAAITSNGVADKETVIAALGASRHGATLAQVERLLVQARVLSDERLLALKGTLTGLGLFGKDSQAVPGLSENTARSAGALLVEAPNPTVAMVDPADDCIDTVLVELRSRGLHTFDIILMTTEQFRVLYRGLYGQSQVKLQVGAEDIFTILEECSKRRGSDIHLTIGQSPMLRVDGRLAALPYAPVDVDWMRRQVTMLSKTRLDELNRAHSLDFAYAYGELRFRFNIGRDRHGYNIVARLLASKIPTMDDIKLPTAVRDFTHLERGMVLVTGPTGSGKSTTLAALLDHIARTQARHLITLEDPIEYVLNCGPNAVVNQRELEVDFTTFPAALKQALRQDPDVILVGEMRDLETARTAITAAETGHLVFSTLHTYDAASTVARLVSMFPDGEQDHARQKLAYILKGVVSQTLVPRAHGPGRVAAMEIMIGTPAIANNLKTAQGMSFLSSTIQTGKKEGMQTIDMALADLVKRAIISAEEAEFRCRNLEELHRYMNHN